jgi:hypothetical protein
MAVSTIAKKRAPTVGSHATSLVAGRISSSHSVTIEAAFAAVATDAINRPEATKRSSPIDALSRQQAVEAGNPHNSIHRLSAQSAKRRLKPIRPLRTDSLPLVSKIYWRGSADDAIMDAP